MPWGGYGTPKMNLVVRLPTNPRNFFLLGAQEAKSFLLFIFLSQTEQKAGGLMG
jgi:hypothetical protein